MSWSNAYQVKNPISRHWRNSKIYKSKLIPNFQNLQNYPDTLFMLSWLLIIISCEALDALVQQSQSTDILLKP